MKNIKYLIILLFISFFAVSCDEDLDVIVMPEETVVSAPVFSEGMVSSVVLSEEFAEETAVTLEYSAAKSDYNGSMTYYIVVGKVGEDFNFASAQIVSTYSAGLTLDVTHEQLNLPLVSMGYAPGKAQEVELRVMASLNVDKNFAFSDPIKMTITPYEVDLGGEPSLPKMFMIGNYEVIGSWQTSDAAEMLAHDNDEDGVVDFYDACLYLIPGSGFKFIDAAADSWKGVSLNLGLGEEGDNGTLINSGESADIQVAEAGFYYVYLDVANLKYKYVKMEWGVIGNLNTWGAEEPIAYDKDAGAYVGTVTIPEDQKGWKLRSENTGIAVYESNDGAWKYNFGPGSKTIHDAGVPNYEEEAGELKLTFTIGFQCDATLTIE